MSEIRRLIHQLVLLLVVLFVLYLLVVFLPFALKTGPMQRVSEPLSIDVPRPTPESARIAAAPQSFQYLVSLTERGLEPAVLTVKSGDTVRFVDNMGTGMHIAATSSAVYPGKAACGASSFDSCSVVPAHGYWEFTFDAHGSWRYTDIGSGASGLITVR